MLIQKIKTYKWQALASLLMTGLMVASSLLQPRYLQEVLDALLAGKYEAIYSIGAWLIGVAVVGLVAGGLNVVLAAYIAQGVSSDLREDAFRKIQTFSYANIEQFNAGKSSRSNDQRYQPDSERGHDDLPNSFQAPPLVHRFVYPGGSNFTFSVVGDCSHGSLDFWLDCCHDGNDGTSFCQVSNSS